MASGPSCWAVAGPEAPSRSPGYLRRKDKGLFYTGVFCFVLFFICKIVLGLSVFIWTGQ